MDSCAQTHTYTNTNIHKHTQTSKSSAYFVRTKCHPSVVFSDENLATNNQKLYQQYRYG